MTELVEIKLRLPKHLVEWLQNFSDSIAMTPDQLVANILAYYYEAWRVGFDQAREALSETKTIPDILSEEIIKKIPAIKNRFLIYRFIEWLKERGITSIRDIISRNSELIKAFIEDYSKEKNLKKTTLSTYKKSLESFILFIKLLKDSGVYRENS